MSVIYILSKHAWVLLLKNKKSEMITKGFQRNLDELVCTPNKIWVDKGSNFTIDQWNHGYKELCL